MLCSHYLLLHFLPHKAFMLAIKEIGVVYFNQQMGAVLFCALLCTAFTGQNMIFSCFFAVFPFFHFY